jgi:hypothetical protein
MKVTDNSVAAPAVSASQFFNGDLHDFLASAEGLLTHNQIFAAARNAAVGTEDYLSAHTWARETVEYGGAALLLGGAILGGSRLTRLPTGARALEELLNQNAFSIVSRRSMKLIANLRPTAEADQASALQAIKGMRELRFLALDRLQPNWLTRAGTAVNDLGYPKIATHLFDRAVLERPPIAQDLSPTPLQVQNINLYSDLSARQQGVFDLLMQRGASQLKIGMIPQANRSFDMAAAHAGETRAITTTVTARTQAFAAALVRLDPTTRNGIVSARQAAPVDKVDLLMQEIAPDPVRFAKDFLRHLQAAPQALAESPTQARTATRELHRLARDYETTEFLRQGPYIGQDHNPYWEANVGIALKNMGHPELSLRYLNPYLEQRLPKAERLAALPLNSGLETAMRLKVADALIAQGQALVRLDHPLSAWVVFKKVKSVAPTGSPQLFQSWVEAQRAALANRI